MRAPERGGAHHYAQRSVQCPTNERENKKTSHHPLAAPSKSCEALTCRALPGNSILSKHGEPSAHEICVRARRARRRKGKGDGALLYYAARTQLVEIFVTGGVLNAPTRLLRGDTCPPSPSPHTHQRASSTSPPQVSTEFLRIRGICLANSGICCRQATLLCSTPALSSPDCRRLRSLGSCLRRGLVGLVGDGGSEGWIFREGAGGGSSSRSRSTCRR